MKFFRHRRAAHDRSTFEHLDFQTGHSEVGGASQSVVTCTDDDDVVRLHRGALAEETIAWSGMGDGARKSRDLLTELKRVQQWGQTVSGVLPNVAHYTL